MDICQHGYFYRLSSYNFILEESPKKKSLYIVQLSINITTNYIKLNLQKLTGMEEYKLKTWGMYQLLINSSVCHVFEVSRKFLPLYTFFKPLESSFWVWHIVADPRANNCVGGRKTAVLTHFESFHVRVKPKTLLYFSLPKLFVPGFPKIV